MNWLIVHFVSGQSFFSGIVLIWLSAWLGLKDSRRAGIFAGILCLVGAIFVFLSTTPLPLWFYVPASLATLLWLCLFRKKSLTVSRRKQLAAVVAFIWVTGAALEAPYHFTSTIPAAGNSKALTIFGDSVTAGLRDGETTWPTILAKSSDWQIHDNAFAGATTATAYKKFADTIIPQGIVLIELGGNDIFGAGNVDSYAENLEALLKMVSKPGNVVAMLELPLPPLHYEFGTRQRALAKKYGVHLIPKRVFISVLLSDETTLDSIHLSPEGHQKMARLVLDLLPR